MRVRPLVALPGVLRGSGARACRAESTGLAPDLWDEPGPEGTSPVSEVQDALDRGALETGVAVITPEQAFRDCIAEWRASQEREARLEAEGLMAYVDLRATPARPLRVRLCLDEHGPGWLSLLAQCAWLRGGILPDAPDALTHRLT